MGDGFQAYADSTSRKIGNLTIENSEDRVSFYGDIDLTRDQAGLASARALKAVLDAIVETLSGDGALPDKVATAPMVQRRNPLL